MKTIAFNFVMLTAGNAFAQHTESLVDYLKNTGRAEHASFAARRDLYQRLGINDEPYRGTAEQNRNILGVLRVGDAVQDPEVASVFLQNATPSPCRPHEEITSPDSWLLRVYGYDESSCCGRSQRCEYLPPGCFLPGTQQYACWKHDRDLDRSGGNAEQIGNQAVLRAHRDLANSSPDPLIRGVFGTLSWFSPANPPPPMVERGMETGLPLHGGSPQSSQLTTESLRIEMPTIDF